MQAYNYSSGDQKVPKFRIAFFKVNGKIEKVILKNARDKSFGKYTLIIITKGHALLSIYVSK